MKVYLVMCDSYDGAGGSVISVDSIFLSEEDADTHFKKMRDRWSVGSYSPKYYVEERSVQ